MDREGRLKVAVGALEARTASGTLLSVCDLDVLLGMEVPRQASILFLNWNSLVPSTQRSFPNLSFKLRNRTLAAFANRAMIEDVLIHEFGIESISQLGIEAAVSSLETSAALVLKSFHYVVLSATSLDFSDTEKGLVGKLLDKYAQSSIFTLNVDEDYYRSFYTKAYRLIVEDPAHRAVSVLPNLLKSVTDVESIVLFSSPPSHFFIDKRQAAPLMADLSTLFRNFREVDAIIRFHRGGSIASKPLWAATTFAKPQFFEAVGVDNVKRNYAFFPIHHAEQFARDSDRVFVRELLFFGASGAFSRFVLSSVKAVIDAFAHYRFSDSRILSVVGHKKSLTQLAVRSTKDSGVRYSDLMRDFADASGPILQDILDTTSAHSATTRLYSQGSRSLEVVAQRTDSEGAYDGGSELKAIDISKHRYMSVNAFSYLNAGRLDYVYIPNFSVKDQDIRKMTIPLQYQRMGLKATLRVRRTTRAEICFPLKYNQVPVGTLNVESPLPHSFDSDVDYISLLKTVVEEAFERTIGHTDIRFQDHQLKAYAAVHELDQYIELGFFQRDQTRVLNKLFPIRELTHENPVTDRFIRNEVDFIRAEIDDWIDGLYHAQSLSSRWAIKSVLLINSVDLSRLGTTKKDALLFVVKNLIQNIVSHGDEKSNRVILDDRPYFGIGPKSELRVYAVLNAIRSNDILDRLCVAPIPTSEGYRHGMFLVGLMAKVAGGFFFVDREPSGNDTTLLIRIPYSNGDINEAT